MTVTASRLLWVSLAASVVTFVVYARDKSAAQRGGRRTPEVVLHFLGALGGWPGALLAQRMLRHKTRKLGFQILFWLTVAWHVAVLVFLGSRN